MYSSTKSFKLSCPADEVGTPYTARATATSIITQTDADNKALGLAKALAFELLECSFTEPEVTIFYSVAKTATANSQPGYQAQTFTVTLPAGSVYSTVSQAAADEAAQIAAQHAANEARDLGQRPVFTNTEQSASGNCPGYSITITIPAGTVESVDSVSDADRMAMEQAQSQVDALLAANCTTVYYSAVQFYTASCTPPLVGNPVTVTNPVGSHTSTVSQAAANAASLAAATDAANALLVCGSGYWNTEQTYTAVCASVYGPNWVGANQTVTVPANSYFSFDSQAAANTQAMNVATNQAISQLSCVWGGGIEP